MAAAAAQEENRLLTLGEGEALEEAVGVGVVVQHVATTIMNVRTMGMEAEVKEDNPQWRMVIPDQARKGATHTMVVTHWFMAEMEVPVVPRGLRADKGLCLSLIQSFSQPPEHTA